MSLDPPQPTPPKPRGAIVQHAFPELTTEAHPESPKAPSPAWRGVLAKAPERIQLIVAPGRPPAVFRVFYRIPRVQWPKGRGFELVIAAAEGRKEERYALGSRDASPVLPPPAASERKIDPRVLERLVVEGYLNINLVATLVPPLAPGTYVFRAELGALRSPDVRIQVVP
jgi:hypothetical protein